MLFRISGETKKISNYFICPEISIKGALYRLSKLLSIFNNSKVSKFSRKSDTLG